MTLCFTAQAHDCQNQSRDRGLRLLDLPPRPLLRPTIPLRDYVSHAQWCQRAGEENRKSPVLCIPFISITSPTLDKIHVIRPPSEDCATQKAANDREEFNDKDILYLVGIERDDDMYELWPTRYRISCLEWKAPQDWCEWERAVSTVV